MLSLAEGSYGVLITADKNLRFQQKISSRRIAVLVIRAASNDIDDIRPSMPEALNALKSIKPGQIVEVGATS
ncbi:MAG: hypothetical protein WBC25_00555 [Candidatus Acidiferrum sp.]